MQPSNLDMNLKKENSSKMSSINTNTFNLSPTHKNVDNFPNSFSKSPKESKSSTNSITNRDKKDYSPNVRDSSVTIKNSRNESKSKSSIYYHSKPSINSHHSKHHYHDSRRDGHYDRYSQNKYSHSRYSHNRHKSKDKRYYDYYDYDYDRYYRHHHHYDHRDRSRDRSKYRSRDKSRDRSKNKSKSSEKKKNARDFYEERRKARESSRSNSALRAMKVSLKKYINIYKFILDEKFRKYIWILSKNLPKTP